MTPVKPPVYLDHMASTPLDSQVRQAMAPWFEPEAVGNPHSMFHELGRRSAEAVERARAQVAALIAARPGEIVFTSGATEANNLALRGSRGRRHVITSAVEHPSILDCLPVLERAGIATTQLPVGKHGRVSPTDLGAAIDRRPTLISIMAANNEIGTIQPLAEIATICRDRDTLFHTDASQILTTRPIHVKTLGLDLLSLSGHKLYGPMGIGALYVRDGLDLEPLFYGGAQQHGLRPGTLPVALCVGLGEACAIAAARAADEQNRLLLLRERLFEGLRGIIPDIRRNGDPASTLAGCLNVSLPGIDAAAMLLALPELALSTGSACASGKSGPSHVLLAMGLHPRTAHAAIRFGLGRNTVKSDIDFAVARFASWWAEAGN